MKEEDIVRDIAWGGLWACSGSSSMLAWWKTIATTTSDRLRSPKLPGVGVQHFTELKSGSSFALRVPG